MIRQLHLHQVMEFPTAIPVSPKSNTIGDIYEAILQFLDTMEIGTDCLLVADIHYSDELGFTTTYSNSYHRTRNDESHGAFSLPVGLYSFEQLPFTPEKKEELLPLFIRFIAKEASQSCDQGYIRIYKEKRFETAVQFFIPKESL